MALLFAYAIVCAFWLSYLIASMGLQVLWSFALACLDAHALRMKRDMHTHVLVSLFVVGDWVPSAFSTLFFYILNFTCLYFRCLYFKVQNDILDNISTIEGK